MEASSWQLSEFITMISMIAGSFVFIYQEIKGLRQEIKTDFNDVRQNRKAEIESSKIEVKQFILDLKTDMRTDMQDIRKEIVILTEKIARIDGTIAFLRDDHPINKPPDK